MIIGLGIDLVEIDRIQNIITKWNLNFLNKVYTSNEISYCEQKMSIASSLMLDTLQQKKP